MSREITLQTEKTKLEEKFIKEMGDHTAAEFILKHDRMSKEELNARILELAKTQQGILNTKKSDKDLEALKDAAREHARKYNEQLSANRDLTRFAALLLSEKFGDALMDVVEVVESEGD